MILDVDETVLDNSGYQAWNAIKDTTFDPKTWTAYVQLRDVVAHSRVPLEFVQYAASKGVRVFYVSNRTAEEDAGDEEEPREVRLPRSTGPSTRS